MDALLLKYTIASADMRYIEVGERLVYLRQGPANIPVLRGEFAGCGSDCYIDLSQIFLEYALSCEGCPGELVAAEQAARFGARLAKLLTVHICPDDPPIPADQRLTRAFSCLLSSMDLPYTEEHTHTTLHYVLAYSPIHVAAKYSGTARAIGIASQALQSLCKGFLRFMAPDWKLVLPAENDWAQPIHEFLIAV